MESEIKVLRHKVDTTKINSYNDMVKEIDSCYHDLSGCSYLIYYTNSENRKIFINCEEDFKGVIDFCFQTQFTVSIEYSKLGELKLFDDPPVSSQELAKGFRVPIDVKDDESGEISDCDEYSQEDESIKIYASLQKQASSNAEDDGEYSLAHELGYCIIDMAMFLKITKSKSEADRVNPFREYEGKNHFDENEEEVKDGDLFRGKSIILDTSYAVSDDRVSVARESQPFNISSNEEDKKEIEDNFKHHKDSGKSTMKIPEGIGKVRPSVNCKLDKADPDKQRQLGKMVVLSSKYTQSQSDYVVIGTPGCSVMKTWRVKNESSYKWPKDVYLKCLTAGASCSLPSLNRHLNPKEETDISVRINIPDDADDNKIVKYVFVVCSKEYSNMGDQLVATVQISKVMFEQKALELKNEHRHYIEVDTKEFNNMFKDTFKRHNYS